MKSIFALWLLAAVPVYGQNTVKLDSVYMVGEWQWVNIENGDDFCGIEYGGNVKILGEYSPDIFLVMYWTADGGGTECDKGDYFLISKVDILRQNDLFRTNWKSNADRAIKIMKLLNEYEKRHE
jgi:hypothetical protein